MGKYRHKVTGKIGEYDDGYARVIKALEPVEDSSPVDPCYTCGPTKEPSGEVTQADTADEPFLYEYENEGE